MRIYVPCMRCLAEDGRPGAIAVLVLEDSGIYRMKCDRGHETTTLL
jgi:hypothetical protein